MTTETRTATGHQLGLTSMEEEVVVDALPLAGSVPDWLTGSLVRVTPAKLEAGGQSMRHWFDGLAMLNRFGFAGGRVSYASRFLDSDAYRTAREGGEPGGGFATDPCRSIFKRFASIFSPDLTDNCNVNLTRLGDRYIAMTETPMAIEFDRETLETLGGVEYADRLSGQVTTAHPHHDAERRELVNYVTRFSRKSTYRPYAVPHGSTTRREIASVPVDEPGYMHSFGMSERYLILAEYPLVANPLKLALSGKSFIENYEWKPERGTRLLVIDRVEGRLHATYETDAVFSFHHVNAFERGRELVVDLIAFPDSQIIDALYLDRMRDPSAPVPTGRLRRLTLPLDGGTARSEELCGEAMELPRIDYARHNTRDYRYVYGTGNSEAAPGEIFTRLVKADVSDGSTRAWEEDGCYPGEPVFVRSPHGSDEDDGVLLSVVLDARAERSFLLVLDARTMEEQARAEAPHHIPFGFHGQYFKEVGHGTAA